MTTPGPWLVDPKKPSRVRLDAVANVANFSGPDAVANAAHVAQWDAESIAKLGTDLCESQKQVRDQIAERRRLRLEQKIDRAWMRAQAGLIRALEMNPMDVVDCELKCGRHVNCPLCCGHGKASGMLMERYWKDELEVLSK